MCLLLQDVEDMVTGALRLFSLDRTGLADFALESGGQHPPPCCALDVCDTPLVPDACAVLQVAAS